VLFLQINKDPYCAACPPGFYTNVAGSDKCSRDCKAGRYALNMKQHQNLGALGCEVRKWAITAACKLKSLVAFTHRLAPLVNFPRALTQMCLVSAAVPARTERCSSSQGKRRVPIRLLLAKRIAPPGSLTRSQLDRMHVGATRARPGE
jgi:hypothetical protein